MAEPTIVSSWDEMLAAIANRATNIKYSDEGTKTIDLVSITSKVSANAELTIDFNGWTIDTIEISTFSDSQHTLFTQRSNILNLTVNHLNLYKTAPVDMFLFTKVYSSYFYDIWWESHDSVYTDWGKEAGAKLFYQCYDCKVYMRSQNYAPRHPVYVSHNASGTASYWYNCEIKIDYKWTKSRTSRKSLWGWTQESSIIQTVSAVALKSCYVFGKIDLSGSGVWQGTANNSLLTAVNSIINIETTLSANSSFENYKVGGKALIVIDNGNAESNYQTAIITTTSTMTSEASLKSKTTLDAISFPYIDDDDYRYPQYHGKASPIEEWTWRKSEYINQQVPFLPFFDYPVYVPPVIYPIERADRISVYDIYEPQSGFDHNGVAVLWPSECISYKEDKGRWDINLVHPIDQYGKWTYIVGQNCIKVNGQIFRIDETEIYCDANQQYIKAHANHITYDLNDAFIGDATFETTTGNSFEYEIIQASKTLIPTQQPTPYEYTFELTSDITAPLGGVLVGDFHDQTVTGALYGDDNSFANSYGGQLYRDNFHMSINSTMENLPASPAFQIRYGTDMTKISYTIDFSSWITELVCDNNNGEVWAIAYVGSEWIIHHNKTKRIHFTYPPGTPDTMECLMRDGFNYWQTVSTPKVSIEVSVANIRSDPKYKDFLQLQNMDVGYTGTVYFEQMGIDVDLRIVSIKRNELTGEAIQIVLGNAPNSFIRSPVCSQTIVPNGSVEAKQQQTMQAMQTEIEDVKLRAMRTWGGIHAYTWAESKKYTWEEIKHGISDD